MRNGTPLAFAAVTMLAGMAAIQALVEDRRGSRDVGRHRTMGQIRALGGEFFEPQRMRLFGTRVEAGPLRGRFFVTSEQVKTVRGRAYPRRFTLREARLDGFVSTVGEFQGYEMKAAAVRAAKEAL